MNKSCKSLHVKVTLNTFAYPQKEQILKLVLVHTVYSKSIINTNYPSRNIDHIMKLSLSVQKVCHIKSGFQTFEKKIRVTVRSFKKKKIKKVEVHGFGFEARIK